MIVGSHHYQRNTSYLFCFLLKFSNIHVISPFWPVSFHFCSPWFLRVRCSQQETVSFQYPMSLVSMVTVMMWMNLCMNLPWFRRQRWRGECRCLVWDHGAIMTCIIRCVHRVRHADAELAFMAQYCLPGLSLELKIKDDICHDSN